MKGSLATLLTTCLLTCGVLLLPGYAQADVRNDKQKVEKAMKQLSSQIDKKKQESGYLNSQVTKLEKELGKLTSQYHATEQKIKDAQKRLSKADIERTELNDELKKQQGALAQQLQAMHTAGEQSHLRLLLLQDNPADISRNIEYFNILNRHRTKKIKQLNETSEKLEAVTELAAKERVKLKGLNEKLSVQKAGVEKLATRAAALNAVNRDLSSKEKRLSKLKSQEAKLQQEINRITQAANKKRRDEAARKQAVKRDAELKRQQASANTNKPATKTAVAKKPQPAGQTVTARRTPNKAFSKMRGKLSWPVSGRVIHKYSSRRNEKQRWKGIVITAPGGAKVKAIAPGKVVFAGWMEGYGHLIIIEHDRNYMSLYGYNRAVFKRKGQTVRANETIAAVGNSSGQSQNALYFEIRHRTVPQNPARWLQ